MSNADRLLLYTPGHNIITDTLILHGIIKILSIGGITQGRVTRWGERYEIEIFDRNQISNYNIRNFKNDLRSILNAYNSKDSDIYLIEKMKVSLINQPAVKYWIGKLLESLDSININNFYQYYQDKDHKANYNEGRSKRKTLPTLYLNLSHIYGKYVVNNYEVNESEYRVCDACFTFSSLGLIHGTGMVTVMKKDKMVVNLMSVAPTTDMSISDLIILQKMLSGYFRQISDKDDIPQLALPIYIFSFGETLYSLENDNIQIFMWKQIKQNNFQRATDIDMINGRRILEFIKEIKRRIPSWPEFVSDLFNEEPQLLAKLTEVILFNAGNMYEIIRDILSTYLQNNNQGLNQLSNFKLDELVKAYYSLR